MHAKNETSTFTEGITSRVTPEMLKRIIAASAEAKLKPSIWMRKVIAKALDGDPDLHTVLAELLGFRREMLSLEKRKLLADGGREEDLEAVIKSIAARKFSEADRARAEGRERE